MRHSKTQKHVEGVIPKNVLTVNSIINVHLSGGGGGGEKGGYRLGTQGYRQAILKGGCWSMFDENIKLEEKKVVVGFSICQHGFPYTFYFPDTHQQSNIL